MALNFNQWSLRTVTEPNNNTAEAPPDFTLLMPCWQTGSRVLCRLYHTWTGSFFWESGKSDSPDQETPRSSGDVHCLRCSNRCCRFNNGTLVGLWLQNFMRHSLQCTVSWLSSTSIELGYYLMVGSTSILVTISKCQHFSRANGVCLKFIYTCYTVAVGVCETLEH